MKAFLRATARGYEAAASDPQQASAMLVEESKGALNTQFALKSQEFDSQVCLPHSSPSRSRLGQVTHVQLSQVASASFAAAVKDFHGVCQYVEGLGGCGVPSDSLLCSFSTI